MRAVLLEQFGVAPTLQDVPAPAVPADGVAVRVTATGICRSDWHALMGHDPDVVLPHVPGHEFAGVIEEVGRDVGGGWRPGIRVTAPFVNACGRCAQCLRGDHQVCSQQRQPGFTHWGSFAEIVIVERAEVNLVALPDDIEDVEAAALGCRLATAFRAVVDVGRARAGEWVAVHGCGGVGLSAIQVATACGARVVAVDVNPAALDRAVDLRAEVTVPAAGLTPLDVADAVRDATAGGAHVSLDAVGSKATCAASISSLRTRGRHVQVGLLPGVLGLPEVPMHLVIAGELEVLGSHGMAAHDYPRLLGLISDGRVEPAELVGRTVPLSEAGQVLAAMGAPAPPGQDTSGITVALPGES